MMTLETTNIKTRLLVLLITSLVLLLFSGTTAFSSNLSSDPDRRFQQLHDYYQRLLNTSAGEQRPNWLQASAALQRLQEEHPRHEVAPRSLYLLGMLHHQLYRRSNNPLDLAESITFFQDMQAGYPQHHLADDALFYLAQIFIHDRKDQERAARTLARIVTLYPESKKAAEAREVLQDIRKLPTAPSQLSGIESPASHLAEIRPIRHWSSDSYTRVVIESSLPLVFRSQMQSDRDGSHRLYIDLEDARLGSGVAASERIISEGLLKRVQHRELSSDSVRIVLDTEKGIEDYKIFSLDNPFRVVIDLQGHAPAKQTTQAARARERTTTIPTLTPMTTEDSEDMSREKRLSLAQQLGLGVRRVVIDPGHGGKDPGAISPRGLKEKDVNLRLSHILANTLRQSYGMEVVLTRNSDVFLPLEERTAIANSRGADLFISIHANAAPNRRARGMETYVLDMVASDDEAMRVAARENASSARSFSELQGIVQELLNHTRQRESEQLAGYIQQIAVGRLRQRYGPAIQDRGVRRAPFVVLIGARMPAVLVEVGFLSNPEEERLLAEDRYLQQLAQSIAEGIKQYANSLTMGREIDQQHRILEQSAKLAQ